MDIWEANKLLFFVAFVIPGFVSLKIYEVLFLTTPKESSGQLVDAVAYSSLNYGILFPAIYCIYVCDISSRNPVLFAAFCFFVLFIAPIIWANKKKVAKEFAGGALM